MNFRLLAISAATGLAALALAVFHNVEGVNIEALGVPPAITAKTGFTSDIVIKRLADRMVDDILERLGSRVEGRYGRQQYSAVTAGTNHQLQVAKMQRRLADHQH